MDAMWLLNWLQTPIGIAGLFLCQLVNASKPTAMGAPANAKMGSLAAFGLAGQQPQLRGSRCYYFCPGFSAVALILSLILSLVWFKRPPHHQLEALNSGCVSQTASWAESLPNSSSFWEQENKHQPIITAVSGMSLRTLIQDCFVLISPDSQWYFSSALYQQGPGFSGQLTGKSQQCTPASSV